MSHRFPNQVPYLTWCDVHGKRAFTKGNAKKLKHMLPHNAGMSRYRCRYLLDGWHVGHLPAVVMRGEMTRGEVYGSKEAA